MLLVMSTCERNSVAGASIKCRAVSPNRRLGASHRPATWAVQSTKLVRVQPFSHYRNRVVAKVADGTQRSIHLAHAKSVRAAVDKEGCNLPFHSLNSTGVATGPVLAGAVLLHLPQLQHVLNELTTLAGQVSE
jgi:hypothetical protein